MASNFTIKDSVDVHAVGNLSDVEREAGPVKFLDFISKSPPVQERNDGSQRVSAQRNSSNNPLKHRVSLRMIKSGLGLSAAGPSSRKLLDMPKNSHKAGSDHFRVTPMPRLTSLSKTPSLVLDLKCRLGTRPSAESSKRNRRTTTEKSGGVSKTLGNFHLREQRPNGGSIRPVTELPFAEEFGNSQLNREQKKAKGISRLSARPPQLLKRNSDFESVNGGIQGVPKKDDDRLTRSKNSGTGNSMVRHEILLPWKRDYSVRLETLSDKNNIYQNMGQGTAPITSVYHQIASQAVSNRSKLEGSKRHFWEANPLIHPKNSPAERQASMGRAAGVRETRAAPNPKHFVSFAWPTPPEPHAKHLTSGTTTFKSPITHFMSKIGQKARKPHKNG